MIENGFGFALKANEKLQINGHVHGIPVFDEIKCLFSPQLKK